MSDEAEDREGTPDETSEATGEPQVGAWSSPAPGPRWSEIASEAQSPGPAPSSGPPAPTSGPAAPSSGPPAPSPGPAAPSSGPPAPTPGAESAAPAPATEAGRSRRPSSLRSGGLAAADVAPPRPLRPTFSSLGSSAPGSEADAPGAVPVSEPPQTGRSGQVPGSSTSLLEKLPLEELQALVKRRPEVGLGIAFGGGLVIATILKRLGRR